MIATERHLYYVAFGLGLVSEIPLPELTTMNLENGHTVVDAEVVLSNLEETWRNKNAEENKFFVEDQVVMFEIPEHAIFRIENGKRILISPMEHADLNKIRLYVLGTCMGVLLMQRKILALHGSAIVMKGKAYAFIGNSGAGKSTLASALMNRGYQLLTDDVIPVVFDQHGQPFVIPSYPQQKLWDESLKAFGMDSTKFKPLFERETKFAIPVHDQYCYTVTPLAGVFHLSTSDCLKSSVCPLENLERFHVLFNQTFRSSLIPKLGLLDWHFTESAKLIEKINMYSLYRPVNGLTVNDLVDKVLEIVDEER